MRNKAITYLIIEKTTLPRYPRKFHYVRKGGLKKNHIEIFDNLKKHEGKNRKISHSPPPSPNPKQK